MASVPNELVGTAGRRYQFKKLIQERPHIGHVWLATSEFRDTFAIQAPRLTRLQTWTRSFYHKRHPRRHSL